VERGLPDADRRVAVDAGELHLVGLTNVRAVPVEAAGPSDDAVPAEVQFAGIYSNPPIRIGKAALHSLLRTWLGRLAPGGVAYLVIQKHLGSDSLARWLESEGWPTSRLLSRAGYRILAVTAPGRT
jgi:16S rRNA (guanine1207-N2)-methyltransferase